MITCTLCSPHTSYPDCTALMEHIRRESYV